MMATQCLLQKKSKTMLVRVEGAPARASPPRMWRWRSSAIGTAGGTGYAIEFAGSAIRGLSMEGRMTLCNMAIEGGRPHGFRRGR